MPHSWLPRRLLPSLILPCLSFWASGCATVPDFGSPCRIARLDPAPAWSAGAAWDRDGERLLLPDPGTEAILVFDLDGEHRQTVRHAALEALDFHHPVRIEASGRGFLVGDRHEVVALDSGLEVTGSAFEGLDGVRQVYLGDWIARGDRLLAFVDLEIDDDTFHWGFVRLDPPDRYRLLYEMPPAVDGEYQLYYGHVRRPYVASDGRHDYVLRFQEPTTLYRAERTGLEEVWRIDDAPTRVAGAAVGRETLLGWRGGLYLVERVERPVENDAELEAPQPKVQPRTESAPPGSAARRPNLPPAFLAGQVVAPSNDDWYLSRIDTRNGGRLWRRQLASGVRGGLQVVPGERAWALVESRTVPSGSNPRPIEVTFVDADRIRAIDRDRAAGGEAPLCPGPHGLAGRAAPGALPN